MDEGVTSDLGFRLSRRSFTKVTGVGALMALTGLLSACNGDDDGADEPDELTDEGTEEPVDEGGESEEVTEEPEDEPDEEPVEETDETEEPTDDEPAAEGEGQSGGALNVATVGEPPTLDLHPTSADIVALITWHIYEPLFTWDENYELMPELAETHEIADDGLTQTIQIRDGVTFHNGEPLTSADVIASFERWSGMSALGADLDEVVEEIETVDDLTVVFHLSSPFGAFATLLSRQSQGCAIYPAAVIEASDETGLSEYIGTGPYRFVEHLPDRHILLERYDDYSQPADEPDGYGGHKYRYLDQLYFIPVPDEAARVAGLRAGDYDYLQDVSSDQFQDLEADENVVAELLPSAAWAVLVLNMAEGLMSDQTIRQAAQAALDHEEIAQAAYGADFYDLDPGIMHKETAWHSTVGEELYNRNDPERAAELLEEAGYDGSPIRLATTQEYNYMYNTAAVAEQQWRDAGFEVELQVYDWATLVEVRANPADYDVFTTGVTFRTDPVMQPFISGTEWPGWWDTEEKNELARQLLSESDFDTRFAVFEEMQQVFYEEVPMIKIANEVAFNARSTRIQGFTGQIQIGGPGFWNMWLEGDS